LRREGPALRGGISGYGTVGRWPAFSWASRAALSVASCAGSSLGTKVPDAAGVAGVGDGDAAAAVIIVAPYMTAPTTPPVSIDPAIALPTKILCTRSEEAESFQ
jgi:hypothetical protein